METLSDNCFPANAECVELTGTNNTISSPGSARALLRSEQHHTRSALEVKRSTRVSCPISNHDDGVRTTKFGSAPFCFSGVSKKRYTSPRASFIELSSSAMIHSR